LKYNFIGIQQIKYFLFYQSSFIYFLIFLYYFLANGAAMICLENFFGTFTATTNMAARDKNVIIVIFETNATYSLQIFAFLNSDLMRV